MARVLISGYYGFGNAGDELILSSLLNSLRKLDSALEIVVLSSAPKLTAAKYKVKSINRRNPCALLKELKKTDLLISGGGGLIQDITSFWNSIYYLGIIFLGEILKKKTFLYAQGVGPLRNRFLQRLTAFVFRRMDVLTVRDEYSKRFLEGLGVSHPSLEVTADPVFSLDSPNESSPDLSANLRRVAFVLRQVTPKRERILAAAVEEISKNFYPEIFLIPFQVKEDLPAAERMRQLTGNRVSIFSWRNPEELLDFFSSLDLIVSMRLHGLVLGILKRKIVIGLSDDPKIINLLGDFGFPCVSEAELKEKKENLLKYISQTWQEREKYYKIREERIPFLAHQAERTAQLAVDLLKR